MRLAVAVLALALSSSGCIAVSARAHVDAVTDFERPGVQVGVNVGMGYAGKKSAVLASLGVDSGTAPTLGIRDTIDYVHLPQDDFGWRVGFGATAGLIGDPSFVGFRVAPLLPLRERSSSSQSEKGGGESSYSLLAVSIETALGVAIRQPFESANQAPDAHVGASAGVGLELYFLSRMWL